MMSIIVGARKSALSQKQVQEVQEALTGVQLTPQLYDTEGDLDLTTSLMTLSKTDFFTKEIDRALLEGAVRIAVHSAKDLPEPIPKGLQVVAVTKGVDPADVLVMREGETFHTAMKIGVSSPRRKEMVLGAEYVDIRGTIEARLAQLDQRAVDGVVIAKAALIRLNLLHRNHLVLTGEPAPYQGKLAILAREGDNEMRALFFPLDARRKILSTSLSGDAENLQERIDPFPLIECRQITSEFSWAEFTHVILTSPSSVRMLQNLPSDKLYIVTGKKTQSLLGSLKSICPDNECQEGLCELLASLDLSKAKVLYLRSKQARPLLKNFLAENTIQHTVIDFYEVIAKKQKPLLDVSAYEEIRFSSPSSVKAFISLYGSFPEGVRLKAKGHVTQKELL